MDTWTVETCECPMCGHEAESKTREVSWTMFVPSSWGEDDPYETATRGEWVFQCLNPECNYCDAEPATY